MNCGAVRNHNTMSGPRPRPRRRGRAARRHARHSAPAISTLQTDANALLDLHASAWTVQCFVLRRGGARAESDCAWLSDESHAQTALSTRTVRRAHRRTRPLSRTAGDAMQNAAQTTIALTRCPPAPPPAPPGRLPSTTAAGVSSPAGARGRPCGSQSTRAHA